MICRLRLLLALWLALFAALPSQAQTPLYLPAEPGMAEPLSLVVHGALDTPIIAPLLKDFHRRHPDIALTYRNLTSLEVYQSVIGDDGESGADVVMSSAMPWQYQLANHGHARHLDTSSARAWPSWARWRQALFGITFEPVVIVHRKELTERFDDVSSHADLLDLLVQESDALRGRVVTYDPARSGAGYTYAVEEARLSPRYWDLVAALGGVDAELVGTTQEMLDGLAQGRYLIGYNLLGSYARAFVDAHPELELVIPSDYALVIQRLAFISRAAEHPEAARRFLDYLLSEPGQRVAQEQTPLGAVHPLLAGPGSASALRERLGEALRPIRLGPGLLATLDDLKRQALLARWQREFQRSARSSLTPLQSENSP